jgi:hypothetical protein
MIPTFAFLWLLALVLCAGLLRWFGGALLQFFSMAMMPCSLQYHTAWSLDQCPLYIRFGVEAQRPKTKPFRNLFSQITKFAISNGVAKSSYTNI